MTAPSHSQPIHVAITRRVRPGCEAEFQQALREFIEASFSHSAVLGANMLVPLPGSNSSEFGILRTFQSQGERDAFYNSPLFKAWAERAKDLTIGEPVYRQLHGLEAWFRNPTQPEPPQWKMALLTFIAVWPVSMAVPAALAPLIGTKCLERRLRRSRCRRHCRCSHLVRHASARSIYAKLAVSKTKLL